MDYTPETSFDEPVAVEHQFNEFFLNVSVALRQHGITAEQKWTETDRELYNDMDVVIKNVHEAMTDNINTEVVIHELTGLVSKTNAYMQAEWVKSPLLERIRAFVKQILDCFGLEYDKPVG
jgi:cysteinyl-tRNA synthetase